MHLKTRLRSTLMRYLSSAGVQARQQSRARRKRGSEAVVHYFHQVDDPYSHLAVQKLDALAEGYRLRFKPHLVSKPDAEHQGSAEHFDFWALEDARQVAGSYGVSFAPEVTRVSSEAIQAANDALAPETSGNAFAATAFEVGEALWRGETPAGSADSLQAVQEGDALRRKLGHYQGAMFYFEGEWYWGLDRMRLLEERLISEGFANGTTPLVPEPTPQDTRGLNAENVVLEYFPSLRSPYTAIGHARVLALIERSGVSVRLRPVMPMMMRGVPAPRAKQRYIIADAAREGRAHGAPFGRIVDPFGPPVERAFALFPGAVKLGLGMAFVTAYLEAAWFEGIDITTERGLQQVVSNSGTDWISMTNAAEGENWRGLLDENLAALFEGNLWGVPSFRVTGGSIDTPYACWGQDRIWRVEDEIARRATQGDQQA